MARTVDGGIGGLTLALCGLCFACGVTPDADPLNFGSAAGAGESTGADVGETDRAPTTGISTSGSTTGGDESGGSGSTAEPDDSTTGDGSTGNGSTGAIDETTGGSTGDVMSDCSQDAMCSSAELLGSVSGDENSPLLQTGGWDATWVSFEVTEDNHSIGGEELEVRITLQSPAGVDFDLVVLRGPEGGGSACGGDMHASATAGIETVELDWGEGVISNGDPDGRFFAVQVVPADDACDPEQLWSLTVEGDP